jgi:hypothetical protein
MRHHKLQFDEWNEQFDIIGKIERLLRRFIHAVRAMFPI